LSLRKASVLPNAITWVICTTLFLGSGYLILAVFPIEDLTFQGVITGAMEAFWLALFALDTKPLVVAAVLVLLSIPWGATALYRMLSSLSRTYFDPATRTIIQGRFRYSFDDVARFETTRHWVGVRFIIIPIMIPIGVKLCITMHSPDAYAPEVKIRLYGPMVPAKRVSRKLREEIVSVLDPDGTVLG